MFLDGINIIKKENPIKDSDFDLMILTYNNIKEILGMKSFIMDCFFKSNISNLEKKEYRAINNYLDLRDEINETNYKFYQNLILNNPNNKEIELNDFIKLYNNLFDTSKFTFSNYSIFNDFNIIFNNDFNLFTTINNIIYACTASDYSIEEGIGKIRIIQYIYLQNHFNNGYDSRSSFEDHNRYIDDKIKYLENLIQKNHLSSIMAFNSFDDINKHISHLANCFKDSISRKSIDSYLKQYD